MTLEKQIIELIATDIIDIPISSMSGKLKRRKPKLAKEIDLGRNRNNYLGERVYARIEENTTLKARGMKEGIEKFSQNFPRYGDILKWYIEEQRELREINLYFGVNEGKRLTDEDYMGVMKNLGFSELTSRGLYPELLEIRRKLSRVRDEERSILIG